MFFLIYFVTTAAILYLVYVTSKINHRSRGDFIILAAISLVPLVQLLILLLMLVEHPAIWAWLDETLD